MPGPWVQPGLLAGAVLALMVGGVPASAQEATFGSALGVPQVPVLTLNQDRLYSETLFGKRLQAEFDEASRELAERNRLLTAELTEEERALTEARKGLSAEDFRPLADAFDVKVTKMREDQDARILALQRRRDLQRRAFTGRILPILSELVRDSGAVAILDDRAVILSSDLIDVTDRAITRIDAILGHGGGLDTLVPDTDVVVPDDPVLPEGDVGAVGVPAEQ